jgi:hypothetical protein
MIKIFMIAEIPDEKAQMLLQHIRNFDVAHPGCKFEFVANAPDKTMAELAGILQISPPFAMKKEVNTVLRLSNPEADIDHKGQKS